jgi:methylenetetrahydrofolate reductase (NADPH)
MRLKNKMAAKEFVILAEMLPPKGVDVSSLLANAERVKHRIDAFLVPEMANAVMKMSSLGGALLLRVRGFEAIMQVCCRDRNRLAIQGDLLAAGAFGITHVMAVEGESISYGDHHLAKAVEDIDLPDLLRGIQSLQQGRDMAGVDLTGAPGFTVGSTVIAELNGDGGGADLREIDARSALGAEFFVTQPIFDTAAFSTFRKRVGERKVKLIPTILLLKSMGMARYIDRNIKNVSIPAEILQRIQKSPDKVQECVKIAAELINALREQGCAGVLISTIGWEDKLGDILDKAKV